MRLTRTLQTSAGVVALAVSMAACAGADTAPEGEAAPSGGAAAATGEDAAGDWPGDAVQFVIPTAAGGALDTTFRQIQPYIEAELGVPLAVEYREGGQFAIGTTYVAQEGGDCEPFMFHAIPDVVFSYLTQDVSYTYEDFYPLAGLTTEPSTVWVRDDAPWATMEEFIEDARSRPGEIRVSVANLTNADHLAVLNLMETADIELNIISYDGGGPARNAVIAGEVEAAMGGVFAGQTITEDARALAVFQDENEWPELTDDAPAINDVVDGDIPPIGGAFGLLATRECYENYPERFETLANAIQAATESEEYLATLEELGEESKLRYETPEEFDAFVQEEIASIETLLQERPELFGL